MKRWERTLRVVVGWTAELAGIGLLVYAAASVSTALGAAVAGVALLLLGYVVYGDWK